MCSIFKARAIALAPTLKALVSTSRTGPRGAAEAAGEQKSEAKAKPLQAAQRPVNVRWGFLYFI